jgi:cytochrome d ubiquinol oxidase subunit II
MTEYLQVAWYLILCAAVVMYILLDGFDLGVGSLMFLGKSDEERRIMLNTIGPLWDGNEVWLIIVGGGLFAGFPPAYAAVCSIYYTLVMILLFGIILRAVGIEFRSKVESKTWRVIWDTIFGVASIIITFGAGLLLGSMVTGVPFTNNAGVVLFDGTFMDFLRPFPLNVAFMAIFVFAIHGAVFLLLKTEGDLYQRVKKNIPLMMLAFLVMYFLSSITLEIDVPTMYQRYDDHWGYYVIPFLVIIFTYLCHEAIKRGRDGWAFIYSSLNILTLFVLAGIGFAPKILRSTLDEKYSITAFNASASNTTLWILLTVVVIGLPLVFAYGAYLYKTFSGKTKLHKTSY